jgi:hypothetical protein
VNGRIGAGRIEFYPNLGDPNARYDQLGGRRFSYTLQDMKSRLGRVEVSAAPAAAP